MRPTRHPYALALLLALTGPLLVADPADAGRRRRPPPPPLVLEAVGHQNFLSPQSNPVVLSADGTRLYVANTTSNTVDVIDTANNVVVGTASVGLDPVSLALRPGTDELWVSCHVSDAVNVVDVAIGSASYMRVVETIQAFDANGATLFDEPVGIAFTQSGTKAYVALSSRDQIAVIDPGTYSVTGTIHVNAQEPRAIAVGQAGGAELLYVAAFESGNESEISACPQTTHPIRCSLDFNDLVEFATNPNLPNATKHIIQDFGVPDRDLFVYDTSTDTEIAALEHVGTLLYGIADDGAGNVYIAQTDARNIIEQGLQWKISFDGDTLSVLGNRMFENEIARVDCSTGTSCSFDDADTLDLEGGAPTQSSALATPYGIAVSGNGDWLVVTAAASSRVVTVDVSGATATLGGALDLGNGATAGQQIPRGMALRSDGSGAPQTAYVLNTLENTVSVVNVSNPAAPSEVLEIPVGNDPTPDAVRRGRIAFNNAFASDNGSFSCAGCHPDGNTDQLLWRIGGVICDSNGNNCVGDEPRTTMPVRGLKNTLPLHWDGTLGDPFGGGNGAVGANGTGGTDCTLGDADGDHDCFVDLAEESLGGVMCDQDKPGGCSLGGDQLSLQEIDDMASFLAAVAYPPARSRRLDDTLSDPGSTVQIQRRDAAGTVQASQAANALDGFSDFFVDQGGNGGSQVNTCADANSGCHALPLGADDNSATLAGFDAPTMRGLPDRVTQFSMGLTAAKDLLLFMSGSQPPLVGLTPLEDAISFDASVGHREISIFGVAFAIFEDTYNVRPLDMWQMFEEASTGFSGAQARQVTLNNTTTNGANLAATEALMDELEQADLDGLVNLRAAGIRNGAPVVLELRAGGSYDNGNGGIVLSHQDLIAEAQTGQTLVTLTAMLRENFGADPQPLLNVTSTGSGTTGNPALPTMSQNGPSNPPAFDVSGVDVRSDAQILLDGRPVAASLTNCTPDPDGFCPDGIISIDLDARPAAGLHLVQVQNPAGPLSNELPLCVGNQNSCD